MTLRRSMLPFLAIAVTIGSLAVPAGAIHLFPLAPGDPGGDCGSTLQPEPGGSAGHVGVGPFGFMDHGGGGNMTEIKAGESVTWIWENPFCHSVTFATPEPAGTDGGQPGGFDGSEPQLTKPEGSNKTFTATFDKPGTYDYSCVHHASMGMVGSVVVS